MWKVTPLEQPKGFDGAYNEDGLVANQHILYALGMPVQLRGGAPGRNTMGAGSGADVREHWNTYLAMCEAEKRKILEPIEFAHRYNGLRKDIVYRFRGTVLRTLNQLPPSQREAS
jgi:hypothetical protein